MGSINGNFVLPCSQFLMVPYLSDLFLSVHQVTHSADGAFDFVCIIISPFHKTDISTWYIHLYFLLCFLLHCLLLSFCYAYCCILYWVSVVFTVFFSIMFSVFRLKIWLIWWMCESIEIELWQVHLKPNKYKGYNYGPHCIII